MRVREDALIEAAKAFMSRTLHISSVQSLCGNCGENVNWGEFTPVCEHCNQQWLFVVSGFWISGWEEADYKAAVRERGPGSYLHSRRHYWQPRTSVSLPYTRMDRRSLMS